jgi:hypothetical protein
MPRCMGFHSDIPLLGAVDDAGLLTLVMLWFTRVSTPYQNTIDG